jgi:hypothetical protein
VLSGWRGERRRPQSSSACVDPGVSGDGGWSLVEPHKSVGTRREQARKGLGRRTIMALYGGSPQERL